MKIIQYCQHVLGVGHFFRTLEIARALAGHDVILVTGGRDVPGAELPSHVREFVLPALSMDEDFSAIIAENAEKTVNRIKAERMDLMANLVREERPDIFLVELYPFGRKAFRFELDPVLAYLREHRTLTVCSLRDILVEKKDREKYENRVVDVLNRYFDALLVHADPRVVKLDETFSRIRDIGIAVGYTGFVAPKPDKNSRERIRSELGLGPADRLIVASAGGGQVGGPLLSATVDAFVMLADQLPVTLCCFTGPYLPDADFAALQAISHPRLRIQRFTDRFADFLAAADLSVSMAGYNTCMNVLAAGVSALVLPFAQNREQRMRAEKLAEMGALKVLEPEDLDILKLLEIIKQALKPENRTKTTVDLDGAEYTAAWLLELYQSKNRENQ